MNSPPNRSLSASTNGLDQGSCCGPFGFGGTAGLAPGGGGGGLGTAAFGSAGLGGTAGLSDSAGFSVCSLSFCSSATFKYSGGTRNRKRGRHTKTWIQPHRWNRCQRPLALSSSRVTEHSNAKENRITTGAIGASMTAFVSQLQQWGGHRPPLQVARCIQLRPKFNLVYILASLFTDICENRNQ